MSFWKGKRVFVTGHTGFKGSWLSLWLQRLGAEVAGYSTTPPTTPNLFTQAKVGKNMYSFEGDIRELEKLKQSMLTFRPEIIFHMAAQPLVRKSYRDPIETFATNVMGTVNVFEAARSVAGLRVIINVTSDKCYENKESIWGYRENDPMGGFDPYSASKGCAELVTSAFRNSYFSMELYGQHGVAISSVRAGNVIGGGDWAEDRLIPDSVLSILNNQPIILRNPQAIRPWQHVLEPLHGYMLLAENMWNDAVAFSGAWNFGPPDQQILPVEMLVKKLIDDWGKNIQLEIAQGNQPHEAHYLKLDCSKARMVLGWNPVLTIENTIQWIVKWYQAYENSEDLHVSTMEQIVQYEELIKE